MNFQSYIQKVRTVIKRLKTKKNVIKVQRKKMAFNNCNLKMKIIFDIFNKQFIFVLK